MNWLGYTEEEVWQLTPRKWNALVSVHLELLTKKYGGNTSGKTHSSSKSVAPTGYIDKLNW